MRKILLVDSTKFGEIRSAHFADLSTFDEIVTDDGIGPEYVSEIERLGITLGWRSRGTAAGHDRRPARAVSMATEHLARWRATGLSAVSFRGAERISLQSWRKAAALLLPSCADSRFRPFPSGPTGAGHD